MVCFSLGRRGKRRRYHRLGRSRDGTGGYLFATAISQKGRQHAPEKACNDARRIDPASLIITLNYDLALERCLAKAGVWDIGTGCRYGRWLFCCVRLPTHRA